VILVVIIIILITMLLIKKKKIRVMSMNRAAAKQNSFVRFQNLAGVEEVNVENDFYATIGYE